MQVKLIYWRVEIAFDAQFIELEYILLHSKFHDHRIISFVEDFEGFYHK